MLHLCTSWCVAYNVREPSPCKGSSMFNFRFFLLLKKHNFAKSVTFCRSGVMAVLTDSVFRDLPCMSSFENRDNILYYIC